MTDESNQSVSPLSENDVNQATRVKRHYYSENEKILIRNVHSFFVKLLEDHHIRTRTTGKYIDKKPVAWTVQATGVNKRTLHHIINENKEKKTKNIVKTYDEGLVDYSLLSLPKNVNEYAAGIKKIPAEGLPGVDLSDPKQVGELIKSVKPLDEELEKTFPCSYENCSKRFKDKSSLKKHLHTHGPRKFICDKCDKSFLESSKLKRHQFVHTKDKPFKCTFRGCDKAFSLEFNLRTHELIHAGVRPYACPIEGCTRKFTQSANLKTHILTHSKKKYVKKGIKKKNKEKCNQEYLKQQQQQ